MRYFVLTALAALSALLSSCANPGAATPDAVYVHGLVYADVTQPGTRQQALAVSAGRIVAVGTDADVMRLAGPKTQVVDLMGRAVIPGLIDAHGHYARGALRVLFSCDFPPRATGQDIVARVRKCAATTPAGQWVSGGSWNVTHLDAGGLTRAALDAAAPDHPVLLLDDTGHGAFVNSAGLRALGLVDARADAEVSKSATGEPTGRLAGTTARQAAAKVTRPDAAQLDAAIAWALKQAAGYGITTFVEARMDRETLQAYRDRDQAAGLSARMLAYLQYDTEFAPQAEQEALVRSRADFRSPRIETDFIKLYLDGVPPNRSAFLLSPYESPDHSHATDQRGAMRMTPQRIAEVVTQMDRAGLSVKMHASGDGSVRAALDAVAAARQANGERGPMHSIAHVGLVAPEDLPRFKALNVAADISPPIWIPGGYSNAMRAALGNARYERSIPTGDLTRAGALVIYGSDWPSISASINPWPHLQSLVDRQIGPQQRITLPQALQTMTGGAATALRLGSRAGMLQPGSSADFAVLDRDPYNVPVETIGATRVLLTVFEGRHVHEATPVR